MFLSKDIIFVPSKHIFVDTQNEINQPRINVKKIVCLSKATFMDLTRFANKLFRYITFEHDHILSVYLIIFLKFGK